MVRLRTTSVSDSADPRSSESTDTAVVVMPEVFAVRIASLLRASGCLVPQFPRLRLHLRRSPRPSLKSRCPAEMCSSPLFHCWYSRFGLTDSASHRFRRPKWPLRLSDHRHSLSDRQMSVNHRQLHPKWPLRSSDRRHRHCLVYRSL